MNPIPILIPFYREQEKLKRCLAAIQAQTQPGCEPFVRDNTDDNIYYTAAVNEGLLKSCFRPEVRYVLVLNQDAYLERDCVRRLVEFMDARQDCGIACPLQVAAPFSTLRWGAGTPPQITRGARQVTWGGSLQAFPYGQHRVDDFASYTEPQETYWANGACMLIRTDLVREIGILDKNMRFICSDSDYSFTARARGWKVFVVPSAVAEHSLGASGAAANPELELVKCHDAMYFTRKWLDGGLYRELALEGPTLGRISVRAELKRLEFAAAELRRMLGRPAATTADDRGRYPSSVFQMKAPPLKPWPPR